MKKILVVLILFIMVGVSCGKKETQNKSFILKIGTVVTEQDPMVDGLKELQKKIEERTEGRLTIELYPSSALGSDEDLLEQAIVGANVGILTDGGRYSYYEPLFGIFAGPYLLDTYEDIQKLSTSKSLQDVSQKLEEKGIKILSFNYFQGTRHLFTQKKIANSQDLKGLRIRVPSAPIMIKSLQAMGANPTVLPWSEVYPGLQQKVIDGAEAQVSAAVGAHLYETSSYLTKTGHFQLLTGLSVSKKWFDKLPEDLKTILLEEAFNAGEYASSLIVAKEKEYEQTLRDEGMTINTIDQTEFKNLTDKVYDEFEGYRELKDQVQAELQII